jgi:homocysteine S-methyltransferase
MIMIGATYRQDVGFLEAIAQRPLLLDGGLSTWLGVKNYDLSDELWSARLLLHAPAAIVEAHGDFIRAGADVITTASYQATEAGFAKRGIGRREFRGLLHRSVALAREAIDRAEQTRTVYVAASVGPYGAMLADGSEYRGNYGLTVRELVRFHRDRLLVLAEAEPDVLALETVPDVREAEALLTALAGVGLPAWLSYSIRGEQTCAGQPLEEAFALTADLVGVNCCAPRDVPHAVALAANTGRPVVAYPNKGPIEPWPEPRLIGGCCDTTPADIASISARRP